MDLTKLISLLPSKYYKYVAGTIALCILLPLGYYSVQGYFAKRILDRQTEQIKVLTNEISTLKGEKAVKAKEAEKAVDAFYNQKDRADKAEAKLAQLKPVVLPSVNGSSDSTTTNVSVTPDCMEQIKLVQEQYVAREEVFQEVITEQKTTITNATAAIEKLQDEVITDNKIIAKFDEKDKVKDAQLAASEKRANSEESKKKIYRTTTGVLGVIVLILVL
jgi:ABC-type Na+ efflux pump permease subunit